MSLKNGDLSGTIEPVISIDEFEPKAGNNKQVIVVAFYLTDLEPAEDLNTFIQRGFIDTLDVEVSPSTDEEGRYLVFVEMSRDDTFPNKFQALVSDIENVSGDLPWKVKTYLSDDKEFDLLDPNVFKYVIINPDEYVTKDEFMKESVKKEITEFLQDSMLMNLRLEGEHIIMGTGSRQVVAEMVDIGDYDTVVGRNFLSEAAFNLDSKSSEAKMLEHVLGNCSVLSLGKYHVVNKGDRVMLLKNLEIKLRG